jgi:hypothetical protein
MMGKFWFYCRISQVNVYEKRWDLPRDIYVFKIVMDIKPKAKCDCQISDSHSDKHEEDSFLGYSAL